MPAVRKDSQALAAELLLVADDDVAVIVRRVTADADGLTWDLVIRFRDRQERATDRRDLDHRVEWAGGSTRPRALGGGSTSESYSGGFTADVQGDVTFVLDWPARGISGASASLPATPPRAAGA